MPDTSIVVLIYCLYFRIIFIRIYHINADDISAHLIMCEYRQADIWKKHNLRVEVFGIYYRFSLESKREYWMLLMILQCNATRRRRWDTSG